MSNPDFVPFCDYLNKASRSDAFFSFRPEKKAWHAADRVHWRDICRPAEFKLHNEQSDFRDVSNQSFVQLCTEILIVL